MPIGTQTIYNSKDLILQTVSASGTTFQESKIAAATSSIILFDSNGTLNSQSLVSTTVGTASYVTASNVFGTVTSALTSSFLNGSVTTANTASYITASNIVGTVTSASYAISSSYSSLATTANTASYVTSSNIVGTITSALTASYITSSNIVGIVTSASFATTSNTSVTTNTASYVTASNVVGTVTAALTASFLPIGTYNFTSSWSTNSLTASLLLGSVVSASYCQTASIVLGSITSASYALNADTASFLLGSVTTANTASYITASNVVGTVTSASYAISSSFSTTSNTSITSNTASYVTASNVIGTVTSALTASFLPIGTYNFTSSWSTNSLTASVLLGSVVSASYALTSSFLLGSVSSASVALTASNLVNANNYFITNLTASNISASATVTALSLVEKSTKTIKTNITPLNSQLQNIGKLNPVSFNYINNGNHSIGFIAEEMAEIYPEFTSVNNDAIAYGKITSVLVQAVKELKQIVEHQQLQLNMLQKKQL